MIKRFQKTRYRAFFAKALLASALCLSASGAQAAVFSPKTFTLSNGMQVVIVTNRLSPAVAQMVWYKVGSVDDPQGLSGVAHYLEHMMFKGTAAIPAGAFSQIMAAQGGEENAFTTHDYTAYHEIVAADRLGLVMQMEADRMRHLSLDPQEAAPELSVVLNERQERTDNSPQGLFHEKMSTALYGSHPYGRPVIGGKNEIEHISRDDAASFYRRHYAPNNAILVISGNVDVDEVMRLAAGTFGALPAEPGLTQAELPSLGQTPQHRVEMQDKRVTQPSLIRIVALPKESVSLRRSDALEVVSEILAGGEVGLMYRHFVTEQQTASAITASFGGIARGPSTFTVAATPMPGKDIRTLDRSVEAYLKDCARKGFSVRDVEAAKKRMLDVAVFARDRLIAPAQVLGETLAVGRPISDVEKWPQRIAAITVSDVNDALRFVLHDDHTVTGILEPERGPK